MGEDKNLCHYFIFVIKNNKKDTQIKHFIFSFIFSLCFVVLALNNNNYVIVFYIIPSFTHSSLVLNLSEFLSSAEHKCYFKERGKTKQLLVLSDLHSIFFFLSKLMWTSNCLVFHLLQNIFFCVQHKKEINTGLGQHVSE